MDNDSYQIGTFTASEIGLLYGQSPRLPDKVRHVIRCKHYSIRTEHSYVEWIRRYIHFHDKQHP